MPRKPTAPTPDPDVTHLYQAAVLMGIFAANCGPIRDASEHPDKTSYQQALRSCSRMAEDMAAEMIRRNAERLRRSGL